MSKLNWAVDDPKFFNLNKAQWLWLAEMISKEEKREHEKFLNFVEYAASFWNYEGVKKVRENRERRREHAFMSDKDFEESIKNQEFKNNPWVERIRKMREATANLRGYNDLDERRRLSKSPVDLSYLASLTEED